MDGTITIGTEIDTKKFEKQLEKLEREQGRLRDKKMKLDLDESNAINSIQKVENQIEAVQQKLRSMEENNLPELLDTNTDYQNLINQWELLNDKALELEQKHGLIKTRQSEINTKLIENANNLELVKNELSKIPVNVDSIGSKIGQITKKIVRWGLAVFGIRSAYMAVRQAMNTLASYNPQMAKDIEYIKYALATTLQPVIERLINLVKTLLQYIGYIAKAWFGVNIFARASAKSMNSTVKSAKQLNKQLAGFDEMNVLSDTSSSGGGGAATPSFDLSNPDDIDPPKWLVWIAENKELILGALAGIALGLIAIKLADPTTWVVLGIAAIATLVAFIIKNWDKIKEVLIKVGTWIYDNIIKPVWDNIKILVDNIAQIFNKLWSIVKVVWEGIKNGATQAWNGIKTAFEPAINFFSQLWDKIKSKLKAFGSHMGEIIGGAFKATFNGIMTTIETFLNTPIRAINKLTDVINKIPGLNLGKLNEFKLPRLAQGGIVNNPGSGVMMGSYVAGERGPEAVIPLDDATMDRLGEAIARHMSITNDNKIFMNARQIARQMNITNAESAFATNS